MPNRVNPLPPSEWTSDVDVICSSADSLFTVYNHAPVLYHARTASTVERVVVLVGGVSRPYERWGFKLWALDEAPVYTFGATVENFPPFGWDFTGLEGVPENYVDAGRGREMASIQGGGLIPPGVDPYVPGDYVRLEFEIDDPVLQAGQFLVLGFRVDVDGDPYVASYKDSNAIGTFEVFPRGDAYGVFWQAEVWRGVR